MKLQIKKIKKETVLTSTLRFQPKNFVIEWLKSNNLALDGINKNGDFLFTWWDKTVRFSNYAINIQTIIRFIVVHKRLVHLVAALRTEQY